MKKDNSHLKGFRIRRGPFGSGDEVGMAGVFLMPSTPASGFCRRLFVVADDGRESGWEHVSVHARYLKKAKRKVVQVTPTWEEMCHVKGLFWQADEEVIQFHPREADYVNFHRHCLHLWRPLNQEMPRPPVELVGPGGSGVRPEADPPRGK